MILIRNKEEKDLIERLRAIGKGSNTASIEAYAEEVLTLKRNIADLKIEKANIEESHARRERELTHMIGLEKKRQEVELAQAKKDVQLTAREEALASKEAEFKRQLEFNTARFESMEKYLKENFAALLDRLPTVVVDVLKKK